MKRVLLAFVSLAALTGAAAAADLPPPVAPNYYKAPAFLPAYSWTGFYAGINGGGGWGSSSWDVPATGRFDTSGGLVGGTLGYNYQFGQVVAGLEGDIDWADINGTTTTACPPGCKTTDNWLGTFRGRLGFAADRFMPFITGGLAFGDIQASAPGVAGVDNTNAGWTLGGGLEMSIVGNWTAKAEYLYVDLGHTNCGTSCGVAAGVTDNVSFRTSLVRAGVNYRF
jgi:outer membrane immunogenic protein